MSKYYGIWSKAMTSGHDRIIKDVSYLDLNKSNFDTFVSPLLRLLIFLKSDTGAAREPYQIRITLDNR